MLQNKPESNRNPRLALAKPIVEWSIPGSNELLRQCDVLISESRPDGRLSEILMVITADCDLAHDKHFGKILCLPIVRLERYLSDFWIPLTVRRAIEKSNRKLFDLCSKLIGTTNWSYSREKISEWIAEEGIDAFIETTRQNRQPGVQEKKIDVIEEEIRARWDIYTNSSWPLNIKSQVSMLQQIKMLDNPKSADDAAMLQLAEQTKDLVRGNAPKDVTLIAELSPTLFGGYVILHRFPEILEDSEISSLRQEGTFFRVSRIVEPYSRQIINQFGQLFSTVGLPDEQSESLLVAVDLTFDDIAKRIQS